MEKLRIEHLRPGMILARSIYLPDGRILVRGNTTITAPAISKFREIRLPSVYIESANQGESITELVSDLTRSDLAQSFAKMYQEIRSGKHVSILNCRKPLTLLMEEVLNNQRKIPFLNEIRIHTDYICSHSINVCIIALKIGVQMGYDHSKLNELAIGAVFHDVGMAKVPSEILERIGGLTTDEVRQIQSHPRTGCEILRQNMEIPAASARIAYEHHERFDGSGYPRGIKGDEIHEFSRIIALSDAFDAMTTEKLYSSAKPVPEALKQIKNLKGTEFDPAVVDALNKAIFD